MNARYALVAIIGILIIGGLWLLNSKVPAAVDVDTVEDTFGSYAYACDNSAEFIMTPAADMSVIHIESASTTSGLPGADLTRVESEIGVTYQAGAVVFVGKGETITISTGSTTITCRPKPSSDSAPFNFGD